jgi:hypothetical protein
MSHPNSGEIQYAAGLGTRDSLRSTYPVGLARDSLVQLPGTVLYAAAQGPGTLDT